MSLPTFAIVSAVYNVDRYLPDYFASLDAQTYPHERIRVVLVDDGSTDGSAETCDAWASTTDIDVHIVHQQNAGQGAARNAGIDHLADEDWVTFCDPDDFVAPNYFENIAAFAEGSPDAALLSMHHIDFFESNPERKDSHALRYRFASGDRLVDLNRYPRNFVMSIATSALRIDQLRRHNLRFDGRVRPVLEDAHLIAHYLLRFPTPYVGFVASAIYRYRRRGDGSSTMQTAKVDPRRYTDVIEYGTKDLLEAALSLKGEVPEWLQFETIYDLLWIYRAEDTLTGGLSEQLDEATCERFHELVGACLNLMDRQLIDSYSDVRRTTAQREAMVHGYRPESWRWDEVVIDEVDDERGMVKLVYHFTGEQPAEEFFVGGSRVAARHSKTRNFVYLRRTLLHERIIWVSAHGTLRVKLNGESVALTSQWPGQSLVYARPAQIRRLRTPYAHGAAVDAADAKRRRKRTRSASIAGRNTIDVIASHTVFRRIFEDAWVLMDRSHNANDNAEHLFKYLRRSRRDINAWFVVKKGSADWVRLKAEGYKRLVPHGSLLWKVLCLNATHMISSHVDKYVVDPFPRPGGWKWRFVFLQHGVTKDNLSRWLNGKRIDAIITASLPEYASIAGDGSEYKFTSREVFLTGFPRHDRLAELAERREDRAANGNIVVMPTWRSYLSGANVAGTAERERNESFFDADFARQWRAFVNSSELAALCRERGVGVTFVPHPNLVHYLADFDLPDWIEVATFDNADVQGMIAESALLVTDFSSIAFDAAFVERPVVYFQFDRELVFGGGHIGRPGYYSYVEHGFGPVAENVEDLLRIVAELLDGGHGMTEEYSSRVARTFAVPRNGASRRVTEVIESLGKPLTKKQLRTPVVTPVAPPIMREKLRHEDSGAPSCRTSHLSP